MTQSEIKPQEEQQEPLPFERLLAATILMTWAGGVEAGLVAGVAAREKVRAHCDSRP